MKEEESETQGTSRMYTGTGQYNGWLAGWNHKIKGPANACAEMIIGWNIIRPGSSTSYQLILALTPSIAT